MRLISILDASEDEHFDTVFRTSGIAELIALSACLAISLGVIIAFLSAYIKGNTSAWW